MNLRLRINRMGFTQSTDTDGTIVNKVQLCADREGPGTTLTDFLITTNPEYTEIRFWTVDKAGKTEEIKDVPIPLLVEGLKASGKLEAEISRVEGMLREFVVLVESSEFVRRTSKALQDLKRSKGGISEDDIKNVIDDNCPCPACEGARASKDIETVPEEKKESYLCVCGHHMIKHFGHEGVCDDCDCEVFELET